LYGFIPRTYCAQRVAALSAEGVDTADGDPLDICVISERPITRSEILLEARVVGGIRMVDRGEADDKIVAVLDNDPYYTDTQDIAQVPRAIVDRLVHYFSTYKLMPGTENQITVSASGVNAWRESFSSTLWVEVSSLMMIPQLRRS
jgi:inorganic pyrophosphatase